MTFDEVQSSALDIAVKNDIGFFSKSRTEMGRVVVKLSDFEDISKPTTAWYDGFNFIINFCHSEINWFTQRSQFMSKCL